MLTRVLLIVAVLGLCDCKKAEAPKPVAECSRGCHHLRELQCKLAEPTANGEPCETWCEYYGRDDKRGGVDPACFERAASCEAAERCVR